MTKMLKFSTSSARKNSSPQDHWFEAIEILDKDGDKFLVSWAGTDPITGKKWEPTWVHHSIYQADKKVERKDCTSSLLKTWEGKKVKQNASSQSNWFDAIEVLDQKGDKVKVSWAGIDPSTGKHWTPTWVGSSFHKRD